MLARFKQTYYKVRESFHYATCLEMQDRQHKVAPNTCAHYYLLATNKDYKHHYNQWQLYRDCINGWVKALDGKPNRA